MTVSSSRNMSRRDLLKPMSSMIRAIRGSQVHRSQAKEREKESNPRRLPMEKAAVVFKNSLLLIAAFLSLINDKVPGELVKVCCYLPQIEVHVKKKYNILYFF